MNKTRCCLDWEYDYKVVLKGFVGDKEDGSEKVFGKSSF